jgi:hypothetical protein
MPLVLSIRRFLAIGIVMAAILVGAASGLLGVCGPFTDVAADSFCPFVLEVFYLGITTGTTATTYDPTSNVSRLQMAAFLSRSVDSVLKRGSHRAAMNQFWTTKTTAASAALSAMSRIWVTGQVNPALLYRIDGSKAPGAVTTVATLGGTNPSGIAYDGEKIWTANQSGSVSLVTPGAALPFAVTTVAAGFSTPTGILYDGANIWVTDNDPGTLLKLNSAGGILLTVTVGASPFHPIYDGTNIFVPNNAAPSVSVVRASSGVVLATLTGNGLSGPRAAAFDGQRILVTNSDGNSVSLWKAADLSVIGTFPTGPATVPFGACSDGINFWITLDASSQLARF